MRKFLVLSIFSLVLFNCQIEQEFKFEKDGRGRYSLGFDMSEMMANKGFGSQKNVDTIIKFADILEEKKDSIKKLPKEEQEKIKSLERFDLRVKVDSSSKKMNMKLGFDFNDVAELKTIGDNLKNLDVKELDKLKKSGGKTDILSMNKSFDTKFSKKGFTYKITKEALKKAEKNKDTTVMKDNPFVEMITFKQVVRFPYKIKSVSNKNVKITSDFKGIEQKVSFFDIANNPKVFDVEVEFE